METINRTKITVETTVNAPVEKVWKAFSEPEHIVNWARASDDWHAPKATNDLREGGSFSTTMAVIGGSFSFEFGGIYDKVILHSLIDYTLGDGRRVTVNFSGDEKATHVLETFEAEDENPVEMQQGGWQAILDNFKKYTESLA